MAEVYDLYGSTDYNNEEYILEYWIRNVSFLVKLIKIVELTFFSDMIGNS